MNTFKFFLFVAILVGVTACSGIRVTTDYDTKTDFAQYKTFAFYKTGIDKADISDLDKRRILKNIETELLAKGMVKSETPDILISIFTKAREKVDIYEPVWSPYYYNPYQRTSVSKHTEGTLFIDLIDSTGKKLIWQGVGSGFLSKSSKPEKREENIALFVKEILEKYPPVKE
jgi:hypothetical protein